MISVDHQVALERLSGILDGGLDFHDQKSGNAVHRIHAFPTKFPPQIPRTFIQSLTDPGDTVLDPMMGSGTTVLESFLLGRKAIGYDVDPLSVLLSKTKTTPIHQEEALALSKEIVRRANDAFYRWRKEIEAELCVFWDEKTRYFVNYWFSRDVQIALKSILNEIERIEDEDLKDFFKICFSAIIITKTGGVSLALDLAHTRPHRVRSAIDWNGNVIGQYSEAGFPPGMFHLKRIRSPFEEFERRCRQNLMFIRDISSGTRQTDFFTPFEEQTERITPHVSYGDAQNIPLASSCIDLVVTSPPYAMNAIDYMRAHKFSLVWLGYSISNLTTQRKKYIGSEGVMDGYSHSLPGGVMESVERLDRKKGLALYKYYSEMKNVLTETFRVLKPGGTAVFVVGDSTIRGQCLHIPEHLCAIGKSIGFSSPLIGTRRLDRNRRMMPASTKIRRMHEEYVLVFSKPSSVSPGSADAPQSSG